MHPLLGACQMQQVEGKHLVVEMWVLTVVILRNRRAAPSTAPCLVTKQKIPSFLHAWGLEHGGQRKPELWVCHLCPGC